MKVLKRLFVLVFGVVFLVVGGSVCMLLGLFEYLFTGKDYIMTWYQDKFMDLFV